MEFNEQPAPAEAAPFVEGVWLLSSNGLSAPPGEGLVAPDGCVELVVSLNGPAIDFPQSATSCTAENLHALVVGLATGPHRLRYRGAVELVGVRMRLRGALRLLGSDLAALTDRIVSMDDLLPTLARDLRDAVLARRAAQPDVSGVIELITRRLELRRRGSDERIGRVVAMLSESKGRARISEAARDAGLSIRHVGRCFERWFGVSPKRLGRIARFHAAWTLGLTERRLGWAAIAAQCGYADQAHLCREFREFSGLSPAEARCIG